MRPPKQSPAPLLLCTDYLIYLGPKAHKIYFSLLKIHHDCGFKLWESFTAYPKCLHWTPLVLLGGIWGGHWQRNVQNWPNSFCSLPGWPVFRVYWMGQIREKDFPTSGSGGRCHIPDMCSSSIPLAHLIPGKVEQLCAVLSLCQRRALITLKFSLKMQFTPCVLVQEALHDWTTQCDKHTLM